MTNALVFYVPPPLLSLAVLCTMASDPLFTVAQGHVDVNSIQGLSTMVTQIESRWSPVSLKLAQLLDGLVLAPMLIALHKHVAAWDYNQIVEQISRGTCVPEIWALLTRLMIWLGWVVQPISMADARHRPGPDDVFLTGQGRFLVERSLNMGVAVSYFPMLEHIDELHYGSSTNVFQYDEDGHEVHVDRTMNVIGSGSMHRGFFGMLCNVIGTTFNDGDFAAQPTHICDMGCGDGRLLETVYL